MYKKLFRTITILIVVLSCGTLGYVIIEKWNFFDALYMTVITLATVGYGETHQLTFHGRIFTVFLIISGASIMLYAISSITSFIVEGELSHIFRRNRMLKQISQLRKHYIVCGAGRSGSHIISELAKTKRNFVIVDKDENVLNGYKNYLCINGDATEENTLREAGLERAAGLFAAISTDEDNMFLIVTAREMNPGVRIVAKSLKDASAKKLMTAGASAVVQPNLIGGLRMASEMVRPVVVSFLDIMLKEGYGDLRVEEIEVKQTAVKTLTQIDIQKSGSLLLAVATKEGYKFNPSRNTVIHPGDKLIVMGSAEQVAMLESHL
ncbi:MAG: NAD-binding protein [Elusimicrobia bacterium]|nr:NAD-binding protein [Elusimicrobiota bacterium]